MGYVGAILKNKEGKILFQLRDEKGRNPNKWGTFGGGIEKGETPLQGLIREINEELEIKLLKEDISKRYWIPFINYFIFVVDLQKTPKKSQLHEGKDMKFMTKREFLKTKNALTLVKLFLRFIPL